MEPSYYCGIDIGTYESKGVLIDGSAAVIAYHACPHSLEAPQPGYAEHDAEGVWWHDFCEITHNLLKKSGIAPSQIKAVGCSTIAPCCLPVDGNFKPLSKAMLYGVDVRAHEEILWLTERFGGDEILRRCGSPVSSQSAAAKVLWLKNHRREVYEAAEYFLTGTSYLVAKLTGNAVIDRYTAAAWVPAYELDHFDWSKPMLEPICAPDRLARCAWTCDIAGGVTTEASKQTGLAAGTPVIVGTADAAAEAISAGALNPGSMMLMYGSSVFMIHVTDRLYMDKRLWSGPYLFPDTFAVTAGMSTAGTLTRWFRDQFAREFMETQKQTGMNAYDALAEEAQGIEPGSGGLIVLPYFSGERTPINDPKARGVFFGLNLTHTRGHLFNACMEGVGYGISQHFRAFKENQIKTDRIMAVGGGIKNAKWLQIVSDICGIAQEVPEVGVGAAYGDALLAALGVGRYRNPGEMTVAVRVHTASVPKHENAGIYAHMQSIYDRVYLQTKDLMREI